MFYKSCLHWHLQLLNIEEHCNGWNKLVCILLLFVMLSTYLTGLLWEKLSDFEKCLELLGGKALYKCKKKTTIKNYTILDVSEIPNMLWYLTTLRSHRLARNDKKGQEAKILSFPQNILSLIILKVQKLSLCFPVKHLILKWHLKWFISSHSTVDTNDKTVDIKYINNEKKIRWLV